MADPKVTLSDFTHQAGSYAQARPDYPPRLIDELMADVGVRPGDQAADIGAGTGISTVLLARRGLRVAAVEPNAAMRAQAAPMENVTWIDGTFEDTHLPSASQDWVVAAQAFHWAKPPLALPEMRRILKPGRWFTVFWNNRDNDASPVLTQTQQLIRRFIPEFNELYRQMDTPAILVSTGDFTDIQPRQVRHAVSMSRERYFKLWRSHNNLNATAGPGRFSQFIAALEQLFDREGWTQFDVPYVCSAWSVMRTS